MKTNFIKIIGKIFTFLGIPTVLTFVSIVLWPLAYPVSYIFYPFLSYSSEYGGSPGIKGNPTIFAIENYGLHFTVGYLTVLTLIAAAITFRLSFANSLLSYVFIYWLSAIILHGLLGALGFYYYVETP